MNKTYDSTADTMKHIERVRELLSICCDNIKKRGDVHDISKLKEPEKSFIDKFTPKLAGSTYGSEEYKGFLQELKVGLDHHYSKNSHHPEHYENGIEGMDLFDVLEMLMDWKAATERHNDGNILRSLEINKERFKISDQLYSILLNTIKNMGLNK